VLGVAAAVVVAGATGALGLVTRGALGVRALVRLGLALRLRPPVAFVRQKIAESEILHHTTPLAASMTTVAGALMQRCYRFVRALTLSQAAWQCVQLALPVKTG
jgi:hypothetical protein